MIVEAQRAISAQKQVIIHCNKLKTKRKSVWWGLRKPKTTQIPQDKLFNKANSIFLRIPIQEHFGHMEAIKNIYDLMKMQKPRTNRTTAQQEATPHISATKGQHTEWHKACTGDTRLNPGRHGPPHSDLPCLLLEHKENEAWKKSKARHELHQGGLPPCWPFRPMIS